MDISELLAFSVKNKASDLHLSSGLPPMIRVHGDVRRINLPPLEHKDAFGSMHSTRIAARQRCCEPFHRACCRWKNCAARAPLPSFRSSREAWCW